MAQIQLLRHAKNLMVIGGVWREALFKNPKTEKLYWTYAYILQIFYVVMCFSMFLEFFYLLEAEDVDKLTDNIRLTISCSLPAIKFVVFQNGNIPTLISRLSKAEKTILGSDDQEIKSIYLDFVGYINKFSTAILVLSSGTGILRVATIVLSYGEGTNDNISPKKMIFSMRFPFDQEQYYGLSLTVQGATLALGCLYYCMSQILYISILTFVKAQLKILQHYFQKFDYYVKINRYRQGLQEIDTVKMFIKKHQFIINFVKELNESLKYLLLIEFLLSSLNIASVAFQLISAQNLADWSYSFIYFILLIGQLFILAWHANEINIESAAVSDAVYQSPWNEKSVEVRKMLLLTILRSQKPLNLTVGLSKPLTTQTVISVMNGAYSYVTIMTSNF